MKQGIFILFLLSSLQGAAQEIVINEFMSKNNTTIADEDGDYSDWIELYNTGETALDLTGWHLSDDLGETSKWQIGHAEIEGNGLLLIFASGKDRSGPGELHSNFKISSTGEYLVLSDPDGEVKHYVLPVSVPPDFSYGNEEDGLTDTQVFFSPSSPNTSNSNGNAAQVESDRIEFSVEAGFYADPFALELSSESNAEIRYTLDGSVPDMQSILYTGAIQINDLEGQEDVISLINTGFEWETPKTRGEKARVIKAASFRDGVRISKVYTSSYFVSERIGQRYEGLPVISLSVDADSLFSDSRGIYVPGDRYIEGQPLGPGNYQERGRDWEREVHMEFFDQSHEKQFGQQVGARIHGNGSRKFPQKTLRIYARNEYGGPTLEYAFFEDKEIDEFKRILLRSPFSDNGATLFRDVLSTELVSEMNMDYMAWQLCVVFINGEYWGVHNIRERIDEHFLAQNHQVDPDQVDLLSQNGDVEEGTDQDFQELMAYVQSHDLAQQEAYSYVEERVDIDNLMDYLIAQLYFANSDWPFVNIRYWKSQEEGAKWRWIFYDCDWCMLNHEFDHLDDLVQENSLVDPDPELNTILFNRLLNNEGFRTQFVQRFIHHLSTTFRADRVISKIEEMKALYLPLVAEHNNRWNYPGSVNVWRESIEETRAFVISRPSNMVQQLLDIFGDQYSLYPNPAQSSRGHVNIDMQYTEGVNTKVEVFTTMGELVSKFDLGLNDGEHHPRIPIHDLSAGMYIVRVEYGVLIFFEKLVVE